MSIKIWDAKTVVRKDDLFEQGSIRYVPVDQSGGVTVVVGKLIESGKDEIKEFLFTGDGWDSGKTTAWTKKHVDLSLKAIVALYKSHDMGNAGSKPERVTKYVSAHIKSIDMENKTAWARVSDDSIDRAGEVIELDAWKKGLESFKSHPVLCTSHNYYELKSIIGRCVAVEIEKDGLYMQFKWFAGEGNSEADWGWNLVSKGLAMFSVGFTAMDSVSGDAMDQKHRDAGVYRVFKLVELYEVSQVVVGCNRNALQQLAIDSESRDVREYAFSVAKSIDGIEVHPKQEQNNPGGMHPPAPVATASPEGGTGEPKQAEPKTVIVPPLELATILEIRKTGKALPARSRKAVTEAIARIKAAQDSLAGLLELTAEQKDFDDEVKIVDSTAGDVKIRVV